MNWQVAMSADLEIIDTIGNEIHPTLPEREEVFAEKIRLFPEGALVLKQGETTVGYGISHPWLLYSIPHLDEFLIALPRSPTCLHIHDVVILPQARGHGAFRSFVELVVRIAEKRQVAFVSLVSVYNTHTLWGRYGFDVVSNELITKELKTYGDSARYMVRKLN